MIFWDNVKSLFNTGSQCVFCGKELPMEEHICAECGQDEQNRRKPNLTEDGIAYVYSYGGVIRRLLHSLKYNDDISGAYYAAEKMANELRRFNIDLTNCVITYVPVHKSRKSSRGFDQCEIIAKRLSDLTGIPYVKLFDRIKKTQAQFNLNAAERAQNMSGAFEYIGENFNGGNKTVILIDDICTTGSTLKECIKLLPENLTVFPYVFAVEGKEN